MPHSKVNKKNASRLGDQDCQVIWRCRSINHRMSSTSGDDQTWLIIFNNTRLEFIPGFFNHLMRCSLPVSSIVSSVCHSVSKPKKWDCFVEEAVPAKDMNIVSSWNAVERRGSSRNDSCRRSPTVITRNVVVRPNMSLLLVTRTGNHVIPRFGEGSLTPYAFLVITK